MLGGFARCTINMLPIASGRQDDRVRVHSRHGADFTPRFPRIVEAVRRLKVKSVLLDDGGIVYGHTSLPDLDLIHSRAMASHSAGYLSTKRKSGET